MKFFSLSLTDDWAGLRRCPTSSARTAHSRRRAVALAKTPLVFWLVRPNMLAFRKQIVLWGSQSRLCEPLSSLLFTTTPWALWFGGIQKSHSKVASRVSAGESEQSEAAAIAAHPCRQQDNRQSLVLLAVNDVKGKFMFPFLILAAAGVTGITSAQSQTPLNGAQGDVPTGYSSIQSDGTVSQQSTVQTANTEPDIDALVEQEAKKPLNAVEQKRAKAAKDLADVISGRMDFPAVNNAPIENVALPRAVNQFQQAWEHSSPDQGVYVTQVCPNCIYRMQTRELMVSTIQLPKLEKIAGFDLGDQSTFSAERRNDYTLAIQPLAYNVDTNLNIYTESGMVYPFYVRSLPFQSNLIPDLLVRIEDNGLVPGKFGLKTLHDVSEVMEKVIPEQIQEKVTVSEVLENLKTPEQTEEDFVRTIEFDPASLMGFDGYQVFGSADRKLRPKIVFRDKAFTYIQWDDWDNFDQLTAYVVKHGIDTLVNTRVRGRTLIIESTADLISLKNRDSYLCLRWKGMV